MDKQLAKIAAALCCIFGVFVALSMRAQILAPILQGGAVSIIKTNLLVDYNFVQNSQGTNTQRVWNDAITTPRTNYVTSSDNLAVGWGTFGSGTSTTTTTVTFGALATAFIYDNNQLDGVSQFNGQNKTWTITLQAKLATGSGSFQIGFRNLSVSSDMALSNAFQTFTYTATGTAGSAFGAEIKNGSAGAAETITVQNVRLNIGSTDLGPQTMPIYDGWLGKGPDTSAANDPTYASQGLQFGTSSNQMVYIPGGYSYGPAITYYAAFKTTSPALSANLYPLWGAYNQDPNFIMGGSTGPFARIGTVGAYGLEPNDGNWHVLAFSWTGFQLQTYLDGFLMSDEATGSGIVTTTTIGFLFGNSRLTNGFSGTMGEFLLYTAAHSASQVAQNTTAIFSSLASRSITKTPLGRFLAVDGDSISAGGVHGGAVAYNPDKYPVLGASALSPYVQNYSLAVSGYSCTQDTAHAPTVVDPTRKYSTNSVLFLYCGTNDIGLDGANATQVYDAIQTYVAARHAAGWTHVGVATLLPSSEGPGCAANNPIRDAANVLLRADNAGADYLVDWAADPTIGPDAVCGNATYYSDGIHPTALTHKIMNEYFAPGLASLLGTTVSVQDPTFSPASPWTGGATSVTISTTTYGATILYCQDTTNTCTPSTTYTAPVSFSGTPGFIRAQGTLTGWTSSNVVSWQGS